MHWADHPIAPGKKQWTWGNHDFGYAWDRELTDADGPYVELMAGVYTDNQPDFSFLLPGEMRTFGQHWYPIVGTGPVQEANLDAAVSLAPSAIGPGRVRVGVTVTRARRGAVVRLTAGARVVLERSPTSRPERPFVAEVDVPAGTGVDGPASLRARTTGTSSSPTAREPRREPSRRRRRRSRRPPQTSTRSSELYLTGLHLRAVPPRHASPGGRTGARRCGAIPATAAATPPSASGTCAAASSRTPSDTCARLSTA